MNYYEARQVTEDGRPDTGKWRYTCMNDGRVWEVGYCSKLRDCPSCLGKSFMTAIDCGRCGNKGYIEVADPCPGHDTAEEAYEHQRQYEVDRALKRGPVETEPWGPCVVCHDRTPFEYMVGPGIGIGGPRLCPEHQTREHLDANVTVGVTWSS